MRDAIERYLDQVMRHAALAPADARPVRQELREHLHQLLADFPSHSATFKETFAMLNDQFGDPRSLGRSIAASKGRVRTILKKTARRAPFVLAALAVLAFGIRATVAEAFRVVGDSVAPDLPAGSHCLVYKLASDFRPGDVIVYRPADHPDRRYLGIVKGTGQTPRTLIVTRHRAAPFTIPESTVIGRVFINTR